MFAITADMTRQYKAWPPAASALMHRFGMTSLLECH
jgi:hypothetical protein